MAKKQAAERGEILVARESFSRRYQGADHTFTAGDISCAVRAGHPILKGVEHLFAPVKPLYEVEQKPEAPAA